MSASTLALEGSDTPSEEDYWADGLVDMTS